MDWVCSLHGWGCVQKKKCGLKKNRQDFGVSWWLLRGTIVSSARGSGPLSFGIYARQATFFQGGHGVVLTQGHINVWCWNKRTLGFGWIWPYLIFITTITTAGCLNFLSSVQFSNRMQKIASHSATCYTQFCHETTLMWIYALSSAKFLGLKLRLCKNKR